VSREKKKKRERERKKNKIGTFLLPPHPLPYLPSFPTPRRSICHGVRWSDFLVHLFPPSPSSLFLAEQRVYRSGVLAPTGPMGGTEKFRLGAGSQVVRALPIHFADTFTFLHLASRLSESRSALLYVGFSSLHFSLLAFSLSRRRTRPTSSRSSSLLCARTTGIDRNPGYHRSYRSWHARATWLPNRHRVHVYMCVCKGTLIYGLSSNNLKLIFQSKVFSKVYIFYRDFSIYRYISFRLALKLGR